MYTAHTLHVEKECAPQLYDCYSHRWPGNPSRSVTLEGTHTEGVGPRTHSVLFNTNNKHTPISLFNTIHIPKDTFCVSSIAISFPLLSCVADTSDSIPCPRVSYECVAHVVLRLGSRRNPRRQIRKSVATTTTEKNRKKNNKKLVVFWERKEVWNHR